MVPYDDSPSHALQTSSLSVKGESDAPSGWYGFLCPASERLYRTYSRPQVVPAWLCAFIRHPQLMSCRLHDGIAGLVCWLRRMFPVAARHAARLSMITGNGLRHWGGTGRALEHRSHYPARPRVRKLDSSKFSRSAWLSEAELESHRHRE